MASSPSGSQNSASGSEGDYYLQQQQQHDVVEQRKRKRMLSNRESARRSRMRKQQHLDDLTGEVGQLKKENNQISTSIGVTTELYLKIEAENAVLRAQMAELSNRLQSLNEIMQYINSINSSSSSNCYNIFDEEITHFNDFGFMNPWNGTLSVNQPIMASPDMLMY